MNKSKISRSLCVFLTFLFCTDAFSFPAGAVELAGSPWFPDEAVLAKFGTSRGYGLGIYVEHISPAESVVKNGPYCFRNEYYHPDQVGIYVFKGDEIHTLRDAYQHGLLDIHDTVTQLREYLKNGMPGYDGVSYSCRVYRFGDANLDEQVNLQDVLHVQKGLAGLTDLKETQYLLGGLGSPKAYFLGDYNDDGEVNIEDVLSIQKYIAKMEI